MLNETEIRGKVSLSPRDKAHRVSETSPGTVLDFAIINRDKHPGALISWKRHLYRGEMYD